MGSNYMSKIIVKLTEKVCLIDTNNGKNLNSARPYLVVRTNFIEERISTGLLKVIAINIPDEATDADFSDWFLECKKDENFAIEAFMSQYGLDPLGNPLAEKK